jgi:hypothetical protein
MPYQHAHSMDVYDALRILARKYDISGKEAEETILRWLLRKLGLVPPKCEHNIEHIKARRNYSKAHCMKCWLFMDMISRPSKVWGAKYKGKFEPIESKLERDLDSLMLDAFNTKEPTSTPQTEEGNGNGNQTDLRIRPLETDLC